MKSAIEMLRITEEAMANDKFLARCNGVLQQIEDIMVDRAKNSMRSLNYIIKSRILTPAMIDYITITLLKLGYKVTVTTTNEDGPMYSFVINW